MGWRGVEWGGLMRCLMRCLMRYLMRCLLLVRLLGKFLVVWSRANPSDRGQLVVEKNIFAWLKNRYDQLLSKLITANPL